MEYFFRSEANRVVRDCYKKPGPDPHTYLHTYLRSNPSRLAKVIPEITTRSKLELSQNTYSITKKVLLNIFESFKYTIFTYDQPLLKHFLESLPSVTNATQSDFTDLFEIYFDIIKTKNHKNKKLHTALLLAICKNEKIQTERLVRIAIGLKAQFFYEYEEKHRAIVDYIFKTDEVEKRISMIDPLLETANVVNSDFLYELLIKKGVQNNVDTVKMILKKENNKFLVLKSCLNAFCDENQNLEIFSNFDIFLNFAHQILDEPRVFLGANEDKIAVFMKAFKNLVGVKNRKMDEIDEKIFDDVFKNCETGEERELIGDQFKKEVIKRANKTTKEDKLKIEILLKKQKFYVTVEIFKFFNAFLFRCDPVVYGQLLRKVFQCDLGNSLENKTFYSRSFQRVILHQIEIDERVFCDPIFLISLLTIYNSVECFREEIFRILERRKTQILKMDEKFFEAFLAKLRSIYFITKCETLKGLLLQFFEETGSLQISALLNLGLNAQYDYCSDIHMFNNYWNKNSENYGKTIKSTVNVENLRGRFSRVFGKM